MKVFAPKYMFNFKCIADKCIDSCCTGWDINIDKESYEKYEKLLVEGNDILQNKIYINEGSDNTEHYGNIAVKNGKCSFLDRNNLCDMYKELGEHTLCNTCNNYPRVFNLVDDLYEVSALPSCMEVCKLAFLSKEKLEFVEGELEVAEDKIEIRRILSTEYADNMAIEYFWELRLFIINTLQNKEISLESRINIIAGRLEVLQSYLDSKDYRNFEEILDSPLEEDYIYNTKIDLDFINKITKDEIIEKFNSKRLHNIIINGKEKLKREDILEVLNKEQQCSYIFENYLVNKCFYSLCPFNDENILSGFLTLVEHYKILKVYAIDLVDEEEILKVIQAFSKECEHNSSIKVLIW